MGVVKTTPLSAAGLAVFAAIEADTDRVIAGEESRFPTRTHFMPSDLANPTSIAEALAHSAMVIVIDEHGNEEWLPGTGGPDDWPEIP